MPRQNEAVAKSYAKALFELAGARNQVDAVARELAAITDVLARQPDILGFLARPWVAAAAKRSAAVELATRLELSPLTRDFLGLVVARNRADHLGAIATAYRNLDDQAEGRVRVKLRTAVALSDAESRALAERLSRLLQGKKLVMEASVDSGLLGGFVAEVGSRVLDGSLDTQLERMRERLARA
jgi:F-type H+-transporting ATPase subunit delta